MLEKTVAGRPAALARLEGELDETVATLAPLVRETPAARDEPSPADPVAERVSREAVLGLAGEFATAAGVSAVAAEAGREYSVRAAVPGWPVNHRRVSRLSTVDSSGVVEVPPADPAAVALAVRRLAASSAAGLPAPWPDEVRAAAAASSTRLPDELGAAVREAHPRPPSAALWWVARTAWWLAVVAALIGASWLVWAAISDAAPTSQPTVALGSARIGLLVLLIAGGVVVAVVLSLAGRWIAAIRAKRWRAATERRLSGAVASVAREAVAPLRATLRDYDDARTAFDRAARAVP